MGSTATRTSERARLLELRHQLLAPGLAPETCRDAAAALASFLARQAGLDRGPPAAELSDRRPVAGGKAISPLEASYCVEDAARTRAFLGGLVEALGVLTLRFPGERLRVLYAGCGPFATLALPLMAGLGEGQAGFTLVDVHPASLATARQVVAALGLEAFVDAWTEGDAARVLPRGSARFHLLILECMQAALENEPQAHLTRSLVPLLAPGGLLVPERVAVRLAVAGAARELGPVCALTRDAPRIPEVVELTVPVDLGSEGAELELRTRVHVFRGWHLDDHESSLTVPRPIEGLGRVRAGEFLTLGYREGDDPGFVPRPPRPHTS